MTDLNAHFSDDTDFNYMSEAYIPDVMSILNINNNDNDNIENFIDSEAELTVNSESMSQYLCALPPSLPGK